MGWQGGPVAGKEASSFVAGWLFWTIVFAVLVGPCIYGIWKITAEDTFSLLRVGTGIVTAAFASGVVSWAVNSVVQRHMKKKRIAERKKAKKRKRS